MGAWLGLLGIAIALAGCAAASDRASLATGSLAQALRLEMPAGPRTYWPPFSPARMSNAEADALIARAITEHERRRP